MRKENHSKIYIYKFKLRTKTFIKMKTRKKKCQLLSAREQKYIRFSSIN